MKKSFLSIGFFGIWVWATSLFVNILYPCVIRAWGIAGFGLMIVFSIFVCWAFFQYGKDVPLEIKFLKKIQIFFGNSSFFLSAFLPLSLEGKTIKRINNSLFFLGIVFFLDPLIATMHFKGRKLGDGLHFKEDGLVFFSAVLACNALWLLRACLIISGADLFF